MCKATSLSTQITSLLNEAIDERERLKTRLSELDSILSEVYHELEITKLNACQGYKVTKYIQGILKERRKIKNDLVSMQCLDDLINMSKTKQKFENASKRTEKLRNYQINKMIKSRGVLSKII